MIKGEEVALPMSIQAIIAPPSATNNSGPGSEPEAGTPQGMPSGSSAQGTARQGSMGSGAKPAPSSEANGGNAEASNTQKNAMPPITANTQGVVGFADVTLSTPGGAQGSVVTSEKRNVKLESGTLMLLRVNQ